MTAPNPSPYQTWHSTVVAAAVPWLAGGPNGQAEAKTWPAVFDYVLTLLLDARYCAFPDYAPTDALPHLGGDRGLIQGASEATASFIKRIKTAWGNSPITMSAPGLPAAQPGGPSSGWALAGTPLQVLEELYYGGFASASLANGPIWVQQNGLAFNLSGAPTPGADNSGLLVRTVCSQLAAAMTSNVKPPTLTQAGRSIPSSTPWWTFAELQSSANANVSDTDFCNRFAILFATPPASYPWSALTVSQLQKIIMTWRPNALCVGVYVCTQGKFMGWPVQNQGINTMGATTIVRVWGD